MIDLATEEDPRRALMTPEERFVDDYAHRVEGIALREHKFSTIFSVEDLKQEIWAAVFKEIHKLLPKGEGFVINFMNRAAGRFAEKRRHDEMYATGTFIYTPDEVKFQLEVGAWESTPEGDWDMRLDVRDAYDRLGERDQHLIHEYYREHKKLSDSENRARLRAIDKMAHMLNSGAHVKAISLDDVLREEA